MGGLGGGGFGVVGLERERRVLVRGKRGATLLGMEFRWEYIRVVE